MADTARADELIKSAVETTTEQVKTLLGEHETAQAEARADIEKRLDDAIAKLGQLEADQRAHLERVSLPGVEYDAEGKGGNDKFSLYRAVQLAIGQARPHGPLGFTLQDKAFGVEREVQKHFEQRTYNVGTDQAGGVFVPQEVLFDSIIPQLEARAVVRQAGATVISGLKGDLTWPVEEGGTDTYYIDTEGEEVVTESEETFSTKSSRPRTLAAKQRLTHKMMMQSAIGLEGWINRRFGIKFALREDLTAIEGAGAAGVPRGLVNVPNVIKAANTYLGGGTKADVAGSNAVAQLNDFVYAPDLENAIEEAGNLGFVMTKDVAKNFAGLTDADNRRLFQEQNQAMLRNLVGYPVQTSTQFNGGSSFCAFGDWSRLLILQWGGLTIRAVESGDDAERLRLTILGYLDHDILVEQPKAFVVEDAVSFA